MNAIEYARQNQVSSLYEPRAYRAGKTTGTGGARARRETLLDIKGPGVLRRLWTTHANADRIKCHIYVDDQDQPVLSGFAHELAEAASRICCEAIPLGGFHDHGSVNLYLPIPFARALRIEGEPAGETGDGPYWQFDYSLGGEESWTRPRQTDNGGKPEIVCQVPPPSPRHASPPRLHVIDQDFDASAGAPHDRWIEGGGVIRRISISGAAIDSLLLRIAFDGERPADDRLDGPFQVDAPLQYLVGTFNNACVERVGLTAVIHFPMPFRVRAGIQMLVGAGYGNFDEKHRFNVRVEYDTEVPDEGHLTYFHARFRCEHTNGRDDFECCSTRGRGHFVGVHIFDTGHDHGGGDNIMFDAGADSAGQLHGICGEDYFHMAYMRVWNRGPYSGCPSHSARYRYHLEMPVPFRESFVFNWGSFAGQPAKAVAFWYQDKPCTDTPARDLVYTLTGPFPLDQLGALTPGTPFPPMAQAWPGSVERPIRSWQKKAQQGFVDLCHVHRRYVWPVVPSHGCVASGICVCAETRVYAPEESRALIRLGGDDPIRLYVNGSVAFSDDGRTQPDPFMAFNVPVTLRAGLNTIRVVVGNTPNYNWHWNGFSLVIESMDGVDLAFLV